MPPRQVTIVSKNDPGRVGGLDLLRMCAVLSVILFHYGFNGPTAHGMTNVALPELAAFAKYGYLGVQLFFVISGFAIAYSANGRTATGFAIARAARIYPAFLFCMTATFLVTVAFGAPSFDTTLGQWIANLAIMAPALKQPYMDSVYWTILLELTFYAWVYLLMLSGLFQRRIDLAVLIWLALSLVNEIVIGSGFIRKLLLTDQSGFFASGLLLYELYSGRRDLAVQGLLGLAAACAVVQAVSNVQWWRDHTASSFDDWIVAAVCLAAIVTTMLAVRIRHVPLPSYLTIAIGGLTYPLYLLHQQIGYIAFLRFKGFGYPGILVSVIIIGLMVASWATWKYIERPGQQVMKRGLTQIARRLGWLAEPPRIKMPAQAG